LVVVFVAPIIFWLISMVLALRVFVPVSHYNDIYSHGKALGTYTRILNLKYKRLKYAIMMLVLGFILPVICIIVYQGPVTIKHQPNPRLLSKNPRFGRICSGYIMLRIYTKTK